MINAEEYKKEILENLNKDPLISVNKHNHEIEECTADNCLKCLFNVIRGNKSCFSAMLRWLLSECKEPIKLTRLEYEILKYISDNTKYLYITRNSCNGLFLYGMEPSKDNGYWHGKYYVGMAPFNKLFQFIQWEDEEPTSIKEVLGNCEVIDDDLSRNI